jgi:hypothetical protein
MARESQFRSRYASRLLVASAAGKLAWMNHASSRHCHFGLKSAPQHRDFRPGQEGVTQ